MKRDDLQLYFIMGTGNVLNQEPINVLEKALQSGVTMFQYREKGPNTLTGEAYENFARKCQKLCQQYNVPFIVNDDVELAIKLRADGVHIGQEDFPVSIVRKKIGNMILGVSVHSQAELQTALQYGADYVGIGPIFSTTSKSDARPPSGTDFLQQVRSQYPELPIVAIGGINCSNAHTVFQAGADGIAIISAICQSEDISKTVSTFKSFVG
ncbi:thiamine-phosphate pyrophosphorylase [Lysinibacillus sp. FJAT-14745]|uniref:thiamine phosphate synthase n=1 Tax=Lysinibacillus sp. FJAT-14745 TaxID=1704289 RepID=UPI0006ABDB78|nr:thiamine phosphate synthase [Lysinibacillus sp. FJAT-14745]KOP72690.1 thiamine-phosphate pyrophosphorylase [Lysinibacillus sp. FJAT-14745]